MIEFRSVEDYLWEIREEAAHIDPKVIRLTREYRPSQEQPFWSLCIVASHRQWGELVLMRYYVGSITIPPSPIFNERPEATANQLLQQIIDMAKELGLAVRRGTFAGDPEGKEK